MSTLKVSTLGFKILDWDDGQGMPVWEAIIDHNIKTYDDCDADAKAKGTLLGRAIMTPVADGCSHYLVTKLNAKTVQLTFIPGTGDDYSDHAWGRGVCLVDRQYIESMVFGQDSLDALLAKHAAKQKKAA